MGPRPRLQFERTDWEKAGQYVQENVELPSGIEAIEELEGAVENLISTTIDAVKDNTPLAKPSQYWKRWFNPELRSNRPNTTKLTEPGSQAALGEGKTTRWQWLYLGR